MSIPKIQSKITKAQLQSIIDQMNDKNVDSIYFCLNHDIQPDPMDTAFTLDPDFKGEITECEVLEFGHYEPCIMIKPEVDQAL